MQILADREVVVVSVDDEIRISAATRIELVAGQSSITLDGADIEFRTPGAFTVKGSGHAFLGGSSAPADILPLPSGQVTPEPPAQSLYVKYDEQVVFKDAQQAAVDGRLRFRVANQTAQKQLLQGTSPALGETQRLDTPEAQPLEQALRHANFKTE